MAYSNLIKICIYVLMLSILSSCSRTVDKAESDTFSVEASYFLDYLSVNANNKVLDEEQRILLIERYPNVDIQLLDDSILFVTNVRCTGGFFKFMTNLQINDLQELTCQVGAPGVIENAKMVSTIKSNEWKVDLCQVNNRNDMYILSVYSPSDFKHNTPPSYFIIIGVSKLEMLNVTDGKLQIAVIWLNSSADQQANSFQLDFPEDSQITAEQISVVQ
ncbi:MAG: hypothetical protein KAR42_11775 [candidate division Zixibacteria bacterium]|nr:hypothetical protein [candidate division Zixibacteria bacterium]